MKPKGDTMEIQLRGAQLDVMALAPTGHTVVLGSAGSGKTTMALRLAEVRANLKGSPEVLVVTYNRVLVAYMNALKSFDHGITVDTFHHVCMEYLKGKGLELDHAILGQADREKRIDSIVSENRERYPEGKAFQMPSSVFAKEIEFLEQFGIRSLVQYLAADRTGCSGGGFPQLKIYRQF